MHEYDIIRLHNLLSGIHAAYCQDRDVHRFGAGLLEMIGRRDRYMIGEIRQKVKYFKALAPSLKMDKLFILRYSLY